MKDDWRRRAWEVAFQHRNNFWPKKKRVLGVEWEIVKIVWFFWWTLNSLCQGQMKTNERLLCKRHNTDGKGDLAVKCEGIHMKRAAALLTCVLNKQYQTLVEGSGGYY